MARIVWLMRNGKTVARARVDGFTPEYFALVRSWREEFPPDCTIKFLPSIKLVIDVAACLAEKGFPPHGKEAHAVQGG